MSTKLNSMRFLDSRKVTYSVHEYTYDPDDPPDAADVAAQIGLAPALVYKTLVLGGAAHGRPVLVMAPADRQLDLKRCAAAIGQKRLELLPRSDTERLTGLKVGGIGALALTAKRWPSYLDAGAAEHERIYVNAGQRGVMLGVAVSDLLQVLQATLVEVTLER
jgi:Cys-tRNA(Pro)/Cys-tRNA(Cys) deacylase